MGRLLSLVLGLAVVSFLVYRAIQPSGAGGGPTVSTAKSTLDDVRSKTQDFEQKSQKKADDLMKAAEKSEQ
jgi:hypothetical protein